MRLTLIGAGLNDFEQLTLDALRSLRETAKILYFQIDTVKAEEFFQVHTMPNTECIDSLYKPGVLDIENYQRIFEKCIFELKEHRSIALLVHGHPLVGVSLFKTFRENAETCGYELIIKVGPSSFDNMIIDLMRDPLEKGTIIVDANRLLLFEYQLDTKLDVYIYHVCSILNRRTDFLSTQSVDNINILKDYLLTFYDDTHQGYLVRSSNCYGKKAELIPFTIGDLSRQLHDMDFSTSMFIPGKKPKSFNSKNYERMRITESPSPPY